MVILLILMSYFHNYTESSWVQKYKYTDQTLLVDSLNWEKMSTSVFSDYYLTSFLYNSSFINQHFLSDYVSKLSHLDVVLLVTGGSQQLTNSVLYNSFMHDLFLTFSVKFSSVMVLFSASYQDVFSLVLLFSPDLILAFDDYFFTYYSTNFINTAVASVFDSYSSNLNYMFGEGLITLFLFLLFSWFVVYFFTLNSFLRWSNFHSTQFMRFYLYFFSMSKDTRVQFEAVTQTLIFFIFYWAMTIMAFDDDKEELIEYLDSTFFYFFTFVLIYFFVKHSVHYFSFLESTASGSRSVMFIATQFKGDFLALFSMILRFYSLLLRLNIYDILDDCHDCYYVFIGDFDDDEYWNELFFSLHSVIFFTVDNQDDRSFLLEDENDFSNDLFYIYFLVWGKIFYFLFYTVELTARFGLAFYVIYLVLFEIYGVNCSYREDTYFNLKR